jgi:hypothetical protein
MTPQAARRGAEKQQGSIIVYLALALAAFGILAMIGVSRFGASIGSVLSPNCATAARYMAESGLRYAAARLRACTTASQLSAVEAELNSGNYTIDAARGLSFTLNVSHDSGYTATVVATGHGCSILAPVTTTASSATINLPVVAANSGVVDFSNLADDFMRTTALQSANNPITVNASTRTISFGTLSGTHNAAAIWYAGNATAGCLNGNCTMDNGIRAYFDLQWNSASVADGLVFGIMSAQTNTIASVGGDPYMGELMGWAGPGTSTGSGNGIQPPKVGLEFDTWYNSCNTTPYLAASRCDPTTYSNLDHMAYVFWGSNTTPAGLWVNTVGNQWVYRNSNTYDDNQHGAGSGSSTEPVSSNDPDGSGSGLYGMYYTTPANWLRGGTKYYLRYELTRITTASAGGTYCYLLKTWITSTPPTAAYQNVTADYDAVAYPPALQQVLFLNSTYHTQLNKVFFGWTEATGDYAQNITVGNFSLAFKLAQPSYSTAPAGFTAYWPMYDNVGTTVSNTKGSALNGTITGTARWVPGIMNNNGAALYFNGATYMSTPDNTALDLTSAGGVSLWFKMYASNTGKWLLHKGTTSRNSEAYGVQIDTSGKIRFRLRYGTGSSQYVEAVSTTTPVQGKWYHVAATWQNPGTSVTLYVNGAAEGTAATNTAVNSGGAFYLGCGSTDTSTAFTGIIDEVYLYKQLLTAANVVTLATGAP